MSRNILIIANTYFQIIFAFQMNNTIFRHDDVTLLISDHSLNAEDIALRVENLHFFHETRFVKTTGSKDSRKIKQKIEDFISISFKNKNRYQYFLEGISETVFDELVVFNYSIETYGIYAMLWQKNDQIKVSRYEEGIISYDAVVMDTMRRKVINTIRKIRKQGIISDALQNFYCFFPGFYEGELKPYGIELIQRDSNVIPLLKQVFGVEDSSLKYVAKYIFFTSVYDFEGGEPIGEYDLVCKISDIVGKENIIIKTHPRDSRTIYENNGFHIDKNIGVPWEVILLSSDFSDKVLFTVNSTCVVSSGLLSSDNLKGYYLYQLCDLSGNPTAQKTTDTINKLLKDPKLANKLKRIENVQHIENILEDLK